MELSKAFNMSIEYLGMADPIRVDENGFMCITDMAKFFPKKRLDNWLRLDSTKEFIETVSKFLNPSEMSTLKPILKKRGRYDGGTYAHDLLALEFATWLSPEFKLRVYLAYQNGTQRKDNWNIKRLLASENYKLMSTAVASAHEPCKSYHFSNESRMLNKMVFTDIDGNPRDKADESQLNDISYLEGRNATLIEMGIDYQERKVILNQLYSKRMVINEQ